MLPPTTSPSANGRVGSPASETTQTGRPSQVAQGSTQSVDISLSQSRAETLRSVDPVPADQPFQRLRTSGPDANDLVADLPAGPPPAFIETLLERQARQVFDKPDDQAKEKSVPVDEDIPDDRRFAEVKARFEETRDLVRPGPEPGIDIRE